MALSVWVWTLPDEQLAICTHRDLGALIDLAQALNMPMLGNVDPYDDTRFNKRQSMMIYAELRELVAKSSGGIAEVAHELLGMVELVQSKSHRYLIFIGD